MRLLTCAVALFGAALFPSAARAQAVEPTGPDTVVYTPKRGNVTFTHGKHSKQAECAACHHESRPEKPLASAKQKCGACHTTPATEPMKTTARSAMHDTASREGVCYTCHNREAAAGKAAAPTKCADCHKQDG